MRQVKYYKIQVGLDLKAEQDFLCNDKPFKVLSELAKEKINLSDEYMRKKCNMSLTTYRNWKRELVFVGLLQVRKLNATSYVYLLGEDAIEADDIKHEKRDYERINKMALESLGSTLLIEESDFDEYVPFKMPYLSTEDKTKYDKVLEKYPMPEEGDIL